MPPASQAGVSFYLNSSQLLGLTRGINFLNVPLVTDSYRGLIKFKYRTPYCNSYAPAMNDVL